MAPPAGNGSVNGFVFYQLAEGIVAWFKKLQEPEQTVPNPPAQPQRSRNARLSKPFIPHSDSQSSVRVYCQNKNRVVVVPPEYTVHVIITDGKRGLTCFGPYDSYEQGE